MLGVAVASAEFRALITSRQGIDLALRRSPQNPERNFRATEEEQTVQNLNKLGLLLCVALTTFAVSGAGACRLD